MDSQNKFVHIYTDPFNRRRRRGQSKIKNQNNTQAASKAKRIAGNEYSQRLEEWISIMGESKISELEFLQEYTLRKLPTDNLLEISEYLNLDVTNFTQDSGNEEGYRKKLFRNIVDHLDDLDEEHKLSISAGMVLFMPEPVQREMQRLLDGINGVVSELKEGKKVEDYEDETSSERKSLLLTEAELEHTRIKLEKSEAERIQLRKEIDRERASLGGDAGVETAMGILKRLGLGDSSISTFRKDFKIAEKIGGPVEKRLDYISLCSQISEAKKKGYSEDEIVYGIKKAVVPGELRTYLDSKEDLSLEDVMKMIRGSYSEKSSSEMFQDLNLISQRDNEDAKEFLFRALTLRQRIVDAAEAENQFSDPRMIQSAFLQTVKTGLRQESIRTHMSPFLDKSKVTPDAILIAEINNAVSEENARQKKFNAGKKKVHFETSERRVQVAEISENIGSLKPIMEALLTMSKEMKAMREDMTSMKGNRNNSSKSSKRSRLPVCETCQADGVKSCGHCFKCSEKGHKAMDCKKDLNA